MMKSKKSWRSKMEKPQQPEIKEGPSSWNEKYGGTRMLIATPKMIDRVVRNIPRHQIMTMGKLRAVLASEAGADYACQLTTGIFLRIVAEAAEESRAEDRTEITPWWRVVYDDGTLNPKMPGNLSLQTEYLRAEGIAVIPKGKAKLMVRDFASISV